MMTILTIICEYCRPFQYDITDNTEPVDELVGRLWYDLEEQGHTPTDWFIKEQ